jgi:tellurite resistance protein
MSETAMLPARTAWHKLDYLPVSFFGAVMGLSGLSIAWRLAYENFGMPGWIAGALGWAAIAAFIMLSVGYLCKLVSAPQAVLAEFKHPIAGNLFGTIPISLLLLPIILAPANLLMARILWVAGLSAMVPFAWVIVHRWMSDRQQVAHATPAWFIPVVGMLDVPLAIPSLALPDLHGVMVFGLAVGLFFATPLFTLVFSRLIFEPPIPDALLPSLMILIAPVAVGFSAYVATTGQVDLFAESLFMVTLFLLAVLARRLRHLATCCPFRVSWWAVSFPLAACSVSALRFAAARPEWADVVLARGLLFLATIVVVGLLLRTVFGIARGELRALSG